MAITLVEAAKLSRDDLQRGVVEKFVQLSSVLDRIPFLTIQGNAYAYNEENTYPSVAFRDVNAGYVESTGTVNQKSEKLVILGGDADVDKFIVQTRGNLNDQRAVQTRLKVKALVNQFQDSFINGDVAVDTLSFDGLKKRLTGAQVIAAGTNGIPVVGNGGTDIEVLFDKLDELIALVSASGGKPDALYMNSLILGRIKSAMRRKLIYATTQDNVGKVSPVYDGIPLLDVGSKLSGSLVIPQTETQGASSVASSIYAVRFGETEEDRAVTGLTNGGVQVYDIGELETKPALRTRIEFYTGLAVFGPGAARLTGLLNS